MVWMPLAWLLFQEEAVFQPESHMVGLEPSHGFHTRRAGHLATCQLNFRRNSKSNRGQETITQLLREFIASLYHTTLSPGTGEVGDTQTVGVKVSKLWAATLPQGYMSYIHTVIHTCVRMYAVKHVHSSAFADLNYNQELKRNDKNF